LESLGWAVDSGYYPEPGLDRLAGLVQMMLDVNPELELELDRLADLV
jgi:hypothetical protein